MKSQFVPNDYEEIARGLLIVSSLPSHRAPLSIMAQTANSRTLCSRPGCNRFAVVPPKGYDQNVPVCFVHIEYWDSLFYAEEIRKLWNSPKQHNKAKCVFCGFVAIGKNSAKLPCCGAYSCCGPRVSADPQKPVLYCPKCGDDLALSDEEQGRRETYYYPARRWFAPWEYVENIARDSSFSKHRGHIDIYRPAYEKIVEKGMKIAENIIEWYKITIDCDIYFKTVKEYEEEFDTLYHCYEELLLHLGVSPKITPAFVPPVVRSAFRSFPSEAR